MKTVNYKIGLALLSQRLWQKFALSCIAILFNLHSVYPQTIALAIAERSTSHKLSGLYTSKDGVLIEKDVLNTSILLPEGFPVDKFNYKELAEKRALNSRTFKDDKGDIVIQYSSKHLNYIDKRNAFQPIDTKLQAADIQTAYSWAALEQQYPTYLYKNGCTALSTENNEKIIFNRNCKINAAEINLSDYTVGVEGMYITDAVAGIDKKMVFSENRIETDYILHHIPRLDNDLIVSEEIELPKDYYIQSKPLSQLTQLLPFSAEEYDVYSSDNKEQARFRIPVYYDANKKAIIGRYNLIHQQGKFILEMIVPAAWLNEPGRAYPVTIDPVVTGPVSNYPSVFMDSCVLPAYETDSMEVTIPAGITITGFIVEDSYFADALSSPPALMKHGKMLLSTSCGAVTFSCQGSASDSSGTCYLVPNTDLKANLACCFTPSCSTQTFYITHGLGRDNYGPGCNQNYIYYSPLGNWPFTAYIVGKTVETTQAQWSVFPTTICSDSCTVYLKATSKHGVPPYTITHPWASVSAQYGDYNSCSSTGSDTIALTIPGCPSTCNVNTTLDIPAPVITDACGDTISGLTSKSIVVKPVPVATVNAADVCSDVPFTFIVSSCVSGSTFQWTGSNGSSGNGDINDVISNPDTIPVSAGYTVVPTADGCVGDPLSISIDINPLPIILVDSPNDTIDPGNATLLTATGAQTYEWFPFTGLACNDCPATLASPVITTSYFVTGTNAYGCTGVDTIEIHVNQGTEVLYIPNSFSPNSNELNDLFCVYGSSIKKIDMQIYDRWGELLFNSKDVNLGWDGKYKGTDVVGGVYVYSVTCEWMSGAHTRRNGTVTVVR